MTVTMREIDEERGVVKTLLDRERGLVASASDALDDGSADVAAVLNGMRAMEEADRLRAEIAERRARVEQMLAAWRAQGCREVA